MRRRIPATAVLTVGLLLTGCGTDDPHPVSDDAPRTSGATTSGITGTPRTTTSPRPDVVRYQGRQVRGEWEEGHLIGVPMRLRPPTSQGELLYAARGDGEVYVATGIRVDGRIYRLISALDPNSPGPSGIDLYGGFVLGDRGADEVVADGSYLLYGSVRGKVDVAVTGPDGRSRPVTATSTTALPGQTVFYDRGAWSDDWDQVEAAPLTVTTSDGRTASVRAESWVG